MLSRADATKPPCVPEALSENTPVSSSRSTKVVMPESVSSVNSRMALDNNTPTSGRAGVTTSSLIEVEPL